jgi:hypothetical protein
MAKKDDNTIHVLGEGGSVFKLDLPLHEALEDKLRKGVIRRVNPDGSPYAGPATDVAAPPTKAPAKNAPKADWVAWAVVCGETPDDAEAKSKQDLLDAYAAAEPAAAAGENGGSGDNDATE